MIVFEILIFWPVRGIKGLKNIPEGKLTITSVRCHILRTIKYMIMIFGTLVSHDDTSTCFFHFREILIFLDVIGVIGLKITQNEK